MRHSTFKKWKTLNGVFLSCGLERRNTLLEGLVSICPVSYTSCVLFPRYRLLPSTPRKVHYPVFTGEKKEALKC